MTFYRILLELNYRRKRSHFWARFLKKLIPALLLVFLIDFNARHFRDLVGRLNAWWGIARTRMELGEIAAALDAEYASTDRYPEPEDFRDFVRHWVRPKSSHDPYYDRWHKPYRYHVEGSRFELLSCGPDGECGTDDDVRRQGGFATIQSPGP